MSIDYEAQFVSLSDIDFDLMNSATMYKRRLTFNNAKSAFISSQRREGKGHTVAFAKNKNHYYVWVEG